MKSSVSSNKFFTPFRASDLIYEVPEKFTFPFYYEPHPLAVLAAKELQTHLQTQNDWKHNFGLQSDQDGLVIGKMFGVLVVRNSHGELGYISAFSGKLAESNHHPNFVPPVFDMLTKESFFIKEEEILNKINRKIEALEADTKLIELRDNYEDIKSLSTANITECRLKVKQSKKDRKAQRIEAKVILNEAQYELLMKRLSQESIKSSYYLKDLISYWTEKEQKSKSKLDEYLDVILGLKEERKMRSSALQKRLFSNYNFLNSKGKEKNVIEIFEETFFKVPPTGAGECAAPKLLQYAYLNNLIPIALAEFWWGEPPKSSVRKHGNFYPACKGKCEPILSHMLEGIETDPNPMLVNPAEGKAIEIIYEDELLAVINKPAEFLSVPGINIEDSVYLRMRKKFPKATGPIIVHRLDMSTSGLMLIAKTKEVHKILQRQFIKRSINKRYVALIDGLILNNNGIIDLPLRVDLEDRPRQLVCFEHGKSARTKWEVINRSNGKTKIYFYPVTGRTHQLRVHAAHPDGLNMPIIGDDLYGTKNNRLHLHAESISFEYPKTREIMTFSVEPDF